MTGPDGEGLQAEVAADEDVDAEGFTATERAEALERYKAAHETPPTAEQVARSKAAARQRAAASPVVPSVGAVPVEVPEEFVAEVAALLAEGSTAETPLDFTDDARELLSRIAARVRAEERQRIAPMLLELHRIMEDAIVRGGYREGEAEHVERLIDSLAAGSAVPVTPDDSRFTNHAGAGHEFTFTVEMRGEGCNWSSTLVPVTVRAYNLRDAILQAAAVPFAQWFPAEEDTEQHPAPVATPPLTCQPTVMLVDLPGAIQDSINRFGPVATPTEPGRKCPDGGTCHHECVEDRKGCFRTRMCGPLSGVYPGDTWPPEVLAAEQDGQR